MDERAVPIFPGDDLGEARAFYVDRLGFTPRMGRDSLRDFIVVPRSFRDAWTAGDRLTIGLLTASVALLAFAPVLTEHTWTGATLALMSELHPFPTR